MEETHMDVGGGEMTNLQAWGTIGGMQWAVLTNLSAKWQSVKIQPFLSRDPCVVTVAILLPTLLAG